MDIKLTDLEQQLLTKVFSASWQHALPLAGLDAREKAAGTRLSRKGMLVVDETELRTTPAGTAWACQAILGERS